MLGAGVGAARKKWSNAKVALPVGEQDPQDVYRTLTTGMDGTPMPTFADALTPEQRWQLVDFILSLGEQGRAPVAAR